MLFTPTREDPPVTSCDATIMQSDWDPPKTLTFCRFSRNEIRSHVSTYNSCLEAESETITLNPPHPPHRRSYWLHLKSV